MTLEQGKPLSESLGEISYAASFVEWYAEEAKRLNVESVTSHLPGAEMLVRREALGVAALLTPWNFPSAMLTRKAAAALAAGCTVVAHPSSYTPLSALALAELAERAGLPAGVFNIVPGQAEPIANRFCDDERVRVVSFTGSTEIGRRIAARCASTMKRLVMELGGHAPLIDLRRCGLGQSRRDRHGGEVRDVGSGLPCRQSHLCPAFDLPRFLRSLRRAHRRAEGRRGARGRHGNRPPDACQCRLQGPGADRRRRKARRAADHRRCGSRGAELRDADASRRCAGQRPYHERRDFRPHRCRDAIRYRGRGRAACERDRIRPRRLCGHGEWRPGLATCPLARIRHGSRQPRQDHGSADPVRRNRSSRVSAARDPATVSKPSPT